MRSIRFSFVAGVLWLLVLLASGSLHAQQVLRTWESAPPMPTARYALAATFGDAGDVYAIGGVGNGLFAPPILDTVERFSLATHQWSTRASLQTARAGLAAVLSPRLASIYAIGGEGVDGAILNMVEQYLFSLQEWRIVAPVAGHLLTPRAALAAVLTGDRIYAIGGFNGRVLNTVERFDPDHPESGWTPIEAGRRLTAREKLAAVTLGFKIYAIGGFDGTNVLNLVEVFDLQNPGAGWVTVAPMQTPRFYAAATVLSCPQTEMPHDCIYVIGGAGPGPQQYLDTVEMYDPLTNTWSASDALVTGRSALAAVSDINGEIYVFGGASAGPFFPLAHDTVDVYAPAPDTWIEIQAERNVHADHASTTVPDGRVFTLGPARDVSIFQPNGRWDRGPDMAFDRRRLAAVTSLGRVNGETGTYIYAIGGDNIDGKKVEAYDPVSLVSTPVASMLVPREGLGAAAIVLSDGRPRVYAIGGRDRFSGAVLGSVEIYDPINNVWTLGTRNMPTARFRLAVATSACPRPRSDHVCIYAIGGLDSMRRWVNTVEEYDPTTDSWRTGLAPMPTARWGLAAATASDGRIHAVGGGQLLQALSAMEVYDPASNAWSVLAEMPTPACRLAAASSIDGRWIYVIDGTSTCDPATAGAGGDLSIVQAYRPRLRPWRPVPAMSTPRFGHAAVTAPCPTPSEGTCVYAIGGWSGEVFLNSVEAYSPGAQSWTVTAPMPTARDALAAAAGPCPASGEGQCIYAIGGRNLSGVRTNVEVYDPSTNSWATAAPLPVGRWFFAAASGACPVTGEGQCIYVLGGFRFDPVSVLNTVDVFDPSTGNWTAVAPMSTRRRSLAAVTGLDGRIYAIGGQTNVDPLVLNTVEAFDPRTGDWSPVVSMNDAKPFAVAANGAGGRIYAMSETNLEVYIPGPPGMDRWDRLPTMTQRGNSYAATRGPDGRIYRIGGDMLGTVEALQP